MSDFMAAFRLINETPPIESLRVEMVKPDEIPALWEEMVVCPHRVYNRKSRRVSHNGWRLASTSNKMEKETRKVLAEELISAKQ